jgi:hypothetical protein
MWRELSEARDPTLGSGASPEPFEDYRPKCMDEMAQEKASAEDEGDAEAGSQVVDRLRDTDRAEQCGSRKKKKARRKRDSAENPWRQLQEIG